MPEVIFQPELEAIVMANARRLIKAKKATSNASLYMNLFGTGFGTAADYCRKLGLDPSSSETSYNHMMEFIKNQKARGRD